LLESAKGAFLKMPLVDAGMTPDAVRELLSRQQLVLTWAPFCLMLGAFGKSAQFPLYVWLPDAMEGPTPVSALIHAATMVTAGVYMIARCGTLFVSNEAALTTITCIGAFTALFAATIALRQFDLKKVFAYSTISQLGYMFVAVGVLAPTAAVFHLVTHAFFKALLFLSSGVVMHAMLGHLDMRKMSGLKRVLPKTNIVMLLGCAALAGFPFTSGFFSKDEIIAQAFARSPVIALVLMLTAFLTAYYTFRLYFQVFQGPLLEPTTAADDSHAASHDEHAAVHETHPHNHEPWLMLAPLMILAVGAVGIGWLFVRGGGVSDFLGHSPSFKLAYEMASARFDSVPGPHVSPGLISISGIGLAYLLHLKERARAEKIAAGLQPITGILEAKYWVDELYDAVIVEPLRHLSKVFFAIDRAVVDGVVWAISFVPQLSGFALKLTTQRGYLQGYAATMFFGVLAILLLVFL
jgi:NADH-quinone oxidoreductase subunit L